MPIIPEVAATFTGTDRFIVSFPRSGSTWLRNLVHEVVVQRHSDKNPPPLAILQPSVHRPFQADPRLADFALPKRLLKSHNIKDLLGRTMIYIFRLPADALVSYYHLQKRVAAAKGLPQPIGSVDDYALQNVEGWRLHVTLGLEQARRFPDRTALIAYEELAADTEATFARAAKFLELNATPEELAQSVQSCAFERLKARRLQTAPWRAERDFFRKGRVGGGAEELSASVLQKVESLSAPVYDAALEVARIGVGN